MWFQGRKYDVIEETVDLADAKWHIRFLDMAMLVSTWSKDSSTQVGAVIVNSLRQVIAHGYNGFARGVKDHRSRYEDRETKYQFVVHAEANAIWTAPLPHLLRGADLYSTMFPCNECAKGIIQVGIARVLAPMKDNSRWATQHSISCTMFEEAGVKVVAL